LEGQTINDKEKCFVTLSPGSTCHCQP